MEKYSFSKLLPEGEIEHYKSHERSEGLHLNMQDIYNGREKLAECKSFLEQKRREISCQYFETVDKIVSLIDEWIEKECC